MKAEIAKIHKRNEVKVDKQKGIINNGSDNNYPERMERLIDGSITARSAANMYANFLVGKGFADESLNKIKVGQGLYKDITLYDLLEKVAGSLAEQSGAYTKIRYDGNLKISEVDFVPFKNCRFGLPDSDDYSGKIVYYNNWGKKFQFDKKDFKTFDVFNPQQNIIAYQILKEAKGDITKYKGQIYPLFLNEKYIYPLSPVDVVQDDADTEYQIAAFKNGELSRNFFAKYFLKHAYFNDEREKLNFIDKIKEFTGADNNGSIMVVQGDITTEGGGKIIDDTFTLDKIDQNINDKLFVEWEASIANNIRKAFNAIPKILIDTPEGVFGTTGGKAFIDAANFYNQMTMKDRQKISNYFAEIFKYFHTPIISDFKINPLTF